MRIAPYKEVTREMPNTKIAKSERSVIAMPRYRKHDQRGSGVECREVFKTLEVKF